MSFTICLLFFLLVGLSQDVCGFSRLRVCVWLMPTLTIIGIPPPERFAVRMVRAIAVLLFLHGPQRNVYSHPRIH